MVEYETIYWVCVCQRLAGSLLGQVHLSERAGPEEDLGAATVTPCAITLWGVCARSAHTETNRPEDKDENKT